MSAGLAAFNGVTATGGGIAMLAGTDRFPPERLRGTAFSTSTVPALIMTTVVGGSSLVAAAALLTRRTRGVGAALVAGNLLAVYQIVLLDDTVLISWVAALYLALGLTVAGLAARLWLAQERQRPRQTRRSLPI